MVPGEAQLLTVEKANYKQSDSEHQRQAKQIVQVMLHPPQPGQFEPAPHQMQQVYPCQKPEQWTEGAPAYPASNAISHKRKETMDTKAIWKPKPIRLKNWVYQGSSGFNSMNLMEKRSSSSCRRSSRSCWRATATGSSTLWQCSQRSVGFWFQCDH